jgi:hypothetical protein
MEALRVGRGWGSHIFKNSAHRWRQGCQPYTSAAFYPQEDSWYSFLLEAESTSGLEGLGKLKKSTSSGTPTGNLPACNIVPEPTMLPNAPISIYCYLKFNSSAKSYADEFDDKLIKWWNWGFHSSDYEGYYFFSCNASTRLNEVTSHETLSKTEL